VGVLEKLRDFEQLEKKTTKISEKEIGENRKGLEKDYTGRTEDEKKINNILKNNLKKVKFPKKELLIWKSGAGR